MNSQQNIISINNYLDLFDEKNIYIFPTSSGQARLWFLTELEPDTFAYNEQVLIQLKGNLNTEALQQSFNEIINRHEILRTFFTTQDTHPVQVIVPHLSIELPLSDLTHLSKIEQDDIIKQTAIKAVQTPFKLTEIPLIRLNLLKITQEESILVMTLHHIIADGWSGEVLMKELVALYEVFSSNQSSSLPPLDIQYADFVLWQNNLLQEDIIIDQLSYWKNQLAGIPPLLELPTDYNRPPVKTYKGGSKSFQLNKKIRHQLQELSQKNGVTLFMTLLTAWSILLSKYSGETDIIIGSPIANRNRREIEPLIGFFVNTLAFRTDLSGNPPFTTLLQRVKQVCFEAYNNQDIPFDQLVETLQPQRNLSNHPIFQVMFILQNANNQVYESSELKLKILEKENIISKFDLTLEMKETQEGLIAKIEYSQDLFKPATIDRMASHFQVLLQEIIKETEQPINQLSLLTQSEKQQLLKEWNQTNSNYPKKSCIHQLVETQVEKHPKNIAVIFKEQKLSYEKLNKKANQLAHYLQELGVKPDSKVSICIERSIDLVVGILAILKAGGSYVPLDPTYPKERLSYMLSNSQSSFLLTTDQLLSQLPDYEGHIISLDKDQSTINQYPSNNCITPTNPDNLAYVIYTSGSTGKPKGIAMNHRPLVNLIDWQLKNSDLSNQSKTLQFSPISFDVSFQELFSTWCQGGTLVLIDEDTRLDSFALIKFIQDNSIERLFMPFVALQQLAKVADASNRLPKTLKEVITAGEQLQISPSIAKLFKQLPNCRLCNQYGPSESHVVTAFFLPQSVEKWDYLPPIGRPISNAKIYILDSKLQPVPLGVPGELYIGGISLAKGYINRPYLTAEKFILSPFISGERLYKTGDLARYLPNGNIQYLGRIDNQVKLRGFRIELGEVEAALLNYQKIKEAVVILREDIPDNKQLVAYLVGDIRQEAITSIREHLGANLPNYMIPSAFIIVEKLPLTPSGKIDRRNLPIPDFNLLQTTETFISPQTETQKIITSIWSEVLKLDTISIKSNFFDLGGHSLLATQVISRIRNRFEQEIPLKLLFEFPTIKQLSERIDQLKQDNQPLSIAKITSRDKVDIIPLSFAQQRLWFLNQLEGPSATYNLPGVLHLKGILNHQALEASLKKIIDRHDILRTNFQTVKGKPSQIIHPQSSLSFQSFDLRSQLQTNLIQDIIDQETRKPFNLSEDNLLRFSLVQLGEEEHILLIVMHHIISDGWSISLLIKELSIFYHSDLEEKTPSLSPLNIQYADFAIWQRNYLQGEVLDDQLTYWQKKLAGIPPLLELPTDYPRPPIQSFRGSYQSFHITPEIQEKLNQLSQENGVTLFMTLLTAWSILLSKYSREEDIVIGSPIANRNQAEIEPLIGFFVNTLALRTNLSGNPSFIELLHQVKQVCLEAYAHQDIPFEKLVEVLQPERNLSNNPIFQVMFVLQNTDDGTWKLPGLNLTSLERKDVISQDKETIAQFDLTLTMKENQQSLIGEIEYSKDLFNSSTIQRMVGHFQVLLESVLMIPNCSISDLSLLSESEKNQLLIEWNDLKVNYPNYQGIHQIIESQVKANPDAVAVVFKSEQITYKVLNEKANQLAHYLQRFELKSDSLIGVCLERSIDMIIAILAILKAGAAYVPLDPVYPQERLEYMVSNAEVPVLITQENFTHKFQNNSLLLVCLNKEKQAISQESQENLNYQFNPKNLAYVIYTSGSTGKPKGVMIPHQNLVNAYYAWEHTYQLKTHCRTHLQMASFSFDVFSGDLVRSLCSGGKLVLCPRDTLLDPPQLYQLMKAERIEFAEFVPAVLRGLIDYLETSNQRLDFMNLLVVGSDSWYVKEHEKVKEFCGEKTRFINSYGVSECTIDSSYFEETEINLSKEGLTPIGRPFPNTKLYILDGHYQPVPIGIPGELYISSVGVAKGYLNRPELTKERFIKSPFNPAEILYKTGDSARYLPDGNIEFLGRIDNQVKLRGFRIELGEIEAILSEYSTIREVVVIVREDTPNNQQLVAYLVGDINENNLKEVREYLSDKLPSYMVPAAFVILEKLPLTPNGKINRRALPVPDPTLFNQAEIIIKPKTPTQGIMATIWSEILNLETISIKGNFFELGGHSLLATQVTSRVRELFSIEIPLRTLFECPTVELFSQKVEEYQQDGFTQLPSIQPISNPQIIPLSFSQQRLWFLNQLEGSSPNYNMPGVLHLRGNLNQKALEFSLNKIIERHQVLRTNFKTVDGKAAQVIHANLTVSIEVFEDDSPKTKEQVQRLIKAESQKIFNLETDPLIRVSLIPLEIDETILLITMHHIISDGWSINLFIQELSAFYESYLTKTESNVPQLNIQYADFSLWQRNYLQGDVLDQQLKYWQEKLQGIPPLLELPTDHPRPPIQTFNGRCQKFQLSQNLRENLIKLSRKNGTTLFMTVLTAWATLLSKYSRETDVIIGSPIANRNRTEIESLIGFFVNNLALRNDLSGDPTFDELLNQVRQVCLEAYAHQDVPFEKLVEVLQPERNLSNNPIFQVMFVWEQINYQSWELPELTLNVLERQDSIAQFDLTLSISETPETLIGEIEYNTDIFESETIERMINHFQVLLNKMVSDPDQKISQVSCLTLPETNQILKDWNQTTVNYPQIQCIHQLFEEQVLKTPDVIALQWEEKTLTYSELNQKANQLAHYLQNFDIKPDEIVGLCVNKSFDMIVGILAILKAGGSYLPLDPTYPKERLTYLLNDAKVKVLLTQEPLIKEIPDTEASLICLDKDWSKIAPQPTHNPINQTTRNHLAYVIYTSGSTGQPKGVMIEHKSLINFTQSAIDSYEINEQDRILQFASMSFDAAAEEIYPCLSSGARLVLRNDEMISSVSTFFEKSQAWNLTVLDLPTAYWQQIITELENSHQTLPNSLRLIIIGGEKAIPEKVRNWQKQVGNVPKLLNTYGPTEATVVSTIYPVTTSETIKQEVPIGKPINNVTTYILDEQLNLLPVGVPGELYIGGMGLARGYLNRPELTEQTFIKSPFDNSQLLYKTGDLVRYLPDGNIEYLGRIDNQVKIRGFRIEIGEIESVISRYPQIKEVVVTVREDIPGNKRLVAYVTLNHLKSDDNLSESLRKYLKAKLPNYMIPSVFITLDKLPITTNGKINYRALPVPNEVDSDVEIVNPRNSLEASLVEIWQDVLNLKTVSIYHNFFELGGDSIISIQVVSRAKQAGIKITPKQIFEYQTIAELATVAQVNQVIIANQATVEGISPLTPIQHWFFQQDFVNFHHWNQGILLEVDPNINSEILQQAFCYLINHHDVLRLRFELIDGLPEQIYSAPNNTIYFEKIDLSNIPLSKQSESVENYANGCQSRLNLSDGSIYRILLLTLGNNQPSRLLIVIHHLVIDGVSWRILLEDLVTLYQQISQEMPIHLPPKTTSFQQWGNQLIDYAQSPSVKSELNYWQSISQTKVNPLPFDYSTSLDNNTVASTHQITVTLTEEETHLLLQEIPRTYHTQINDLLLTALVQTFCHWTKESSLLLELEGHGREDLFEDIDLSRTVGWFTTVFPVLLTLPNTDNLGDIIKSIKEQLRVIPNKGIGYGILRYLSSDETIKQALNNGCQPQITFNYLGQFEEEKMTPPFLKVAQESSGLAFSPQSHNSYLIDINAVVISHQLQVTWSYSQNLYQRETIDQLSQQYLEALRQLIYHCQFQELNYYTPSDFPDTNLTQTVLDELQRQYSIEAIYPLSPMQKGMLFHALYESESQLYFGQFNLTFKGNLNVESFRKAWQNVLDRHSILRTLFIWENTEEPLQVVCQDIELPWIYYDWKHLNFHEQNQQLQSLLTHDHDKGFDLDKTPLMRFTLITIDDDTYQLIWSHHHLLLDGWCLPILFEEFFSFYEAFEREESIALAPPIPYQNFIRWLQRQDLQKAESFWRKNLQGFNQTTTLPMDFINNKRKYGIYQHKSFNLSQKITNNLQQLCRQHRLTQNTIIQGAFALLLSHYSQTDDVMFGATVSGRSPDLLGVESMIGLFINTLPVRVKILENQSLISWLKQLTKNQVERESYSYSSLADIKGWSEMSPNSSLFDSILVFENYPIDQSLLENSKSLTIQSFEGEADTTNYPLTIAALPGSEFQIDLRYNPHLFKQETVDQMLKILEIILKQMINYPEQNLGKIKGVITQYRTEQQRRKEQDLSTNVRNKLKIRRRKKN